MKLRGHYEKPSEKKARERAGRSAAHELRARRCSARACFPQAEARHRRSRRRTRTGRPGARGPADSVVVVAAEASAAVRADRNCKLRFSAAAGAPSAPLLFGLSCGDDLSAHTDRRRAAMLLAAFALAGCGATIGNLDLTGSSQDQDTTQAATPTNIASLTEVVQRNPNDAQAYNMRAACSAVPGAIRKRSRISIARSRSMRITHRPTPNRGQVHRQGNRLDPALRRLQQGARARPELCGGLPRPRSRLSPAGPRARRAQRLQSRDPDQPEQRAGLLQSRAALSGAGQHKFAIDDFTTAVGLLQQQAEPYVARGLSQIALATPRRRRTDLEQRRADRAAELNAWTSRGLAYERLGDKERRRAPTPRR